MNQVSFNKVRLSLAVCTLPLRYFHGKRKGKVTCLDF